MLKQYYVACCLAGAAVLSGCKSNVDDPDPAGASVSGMVLAQDEVLRPLTKAGSTVLIEGTDKKTTTDDQGRYTLDGVRPGRYVLNVSRAGMGTLRYTLRVKDQHPVSFPTLMLDQECSTRVTSLTWDAPTASSLPDEVAAFTCQVAYDPQLYQAHEKYSVRVYLGKSSDVSNVNYVIASQYSESENTPAIPGSATFRLSFYRSTLQGLGFNRGDEVYLIAYGAPLDVMWDGIGTEATYLEPEASGIDAGQIKQVIANLNGSPVRASFTMP